MPRSLRKCQKLTPGGARAVDTVLFTREDRSGDPCAQKDIRWHHKRIIKVRMQNGSIKKASWESG
jgi:hypothetical protein